MISSIRFLVAALLLSPPAIHADTLVQYSFEDESLLPTTTADHLLVSPFSLHNAGPLAFGAGSASELFGPRGTAVVGSDWSDDDGYFAFVVTPQNSLLTITGLSFASLKEGSVAPGSSIYYRIGDGAPIFVGQFASFISPPLLSFDPFGGFFYQNSMLFDLTTAGPIEIRISQTGMEPGARFAVDNVTLQGTATPLSVPDDTATICVAGVLFVAAGLRRFCHV